MKHVFIIGSHTPYLTAIGVINKLKIPSQNIIFVFGRNYKCIFHPQEYISYDLTPIYYFHFKNNLRSNIIKQIKEIDLFINNTIKENYTLYVPHLGFYFFQIFATNELCKDIKFIQEGIIDFCNHKISLSKKNISYFLINKLFLRSNRMWKTDNWNPPSRMKNIRVSESFAITDKLFQNLNCKHTVIQWPNIKTNFNLNTEYPIFLFESLMENDFIEQEIFLNATDKIILSYAKEINYIKFHPYQSKQNIQLIINLFQKKGLKIELLPDEIPFEIILSSYKNLNIYGFTTSLIFFAQLMGHNAKICAPLLMQSKKFQKHWNRLAKQLACYNNFTLTYFTNKNE